MLLVLGVAIGIALMAGTDAKGATVTGQSFPPSTVETLASTTGENGTGATATAKRSSTVETCASATGENGTGATATAKRSLSGETSGSTVETSGSTVETNGSTVETSGLTGESSASFTRVNDSTEVVINFRLDKVVYDPAYMGNNERFNELMRLLAAVKADPDARLKNIRITSSASPEGPYKHNVELSIERGKTLIKLIKKQDPTLDDDIFVITSLGEAWDGAIKAVEAGEMPHKDEALEIMRNTPENVIKDGKVVDTRKRQMMNLAGGTVWRYMIENYFPSLRQTSVFVVFKTKRLVSTLEELAPIYACVQQSAPGELARGEVRMPEPVEERKPIIAVKSNLLYDVLATPNIAVELPLGKRWSIFADYTFPWWEWDNNSRAWEDLDWKLGARYWFGDRTKRDVLTGLFAGGFGAAGYYDVQPHHKGWQGEFYAAGLEGGYAWRLSKHWHFEVSGALGYMHTKYRRYHGELNDQHLVYKYNGKYDWVGPVKLNASIVYLFWGKKSTDAKSGRR